MTYWTKSYYTQSQFWLSNIEFRANRWFFCWSLTRLNVFATNGLANCAVCTTSFGTMYPIFMCFLIKTLFKPVQIISLTTTVRFVPTLAATPCIWWIYWSTLLKWQTWTLRAVALNVLCLTKVSKHTSSALHIQKLKQQVIHQCTLLVRDLNTECL